VEEDLSVSLKVAVKPDWKIADDLRAVMHIRGVKSRFVFPLMILPDLFG